MPGIREVLDDSLGRLGCGTGGAKITGPCGFPTIGVLQGISSLTWDRRLDDVSQASITINLGGDAGQACCEFLGDVEPWCHELHITRNGVEQWAGIITQPIYKFNTVTINAFDFVGVLGYKIPAADSDFTATNTNLTEIAYGDSNSIFDIALAEEDNHCILSHITSYPNAVAGKALYVAYGATSLEYLNDLAATGMNYTTLGSTIVLSGEITQLTPLVILRDENIIGEVEVTKDGLLAGNRYYVHFQGDDGLPAIFTSTTQYCDIIERMRTENDIPDAATAQQIAQLYADATAISPRTIVVPAGSKLSPDTPWVIDDMVCGARVDVQLSKLCFEIEQSFILSTMELTENGTDGESVTITLSPINSVGI